MKHGNDWSTTALASSCFLSSRKLKAGQKVVLVARVSTSEQQRNGNLDESMARLWDEAEQRGCVVIYEYAYVGSGKYPALLPAVEAALADDAVLVFETVDRAIRPLNFHPIKNPNAPLLADDLQRLKKLTRGVPLFTIGEPDASPGENRGSQTTRGQRAKGNRGGRPRKAVTNPGSRKAFRAKWLPLVLELHRARVSRWNIAERVTREAGRRITYASVCRWTKQDSAGCKIPDGNAGHGGVAKP
jgi:hypothetical protein